MTTLPIDPYIETRAWLENTISAAQRKLDNICYTMKREGTEHFAHKIQQQINNVSSGVNLSTNAVLSLSQYVHLLEKYEKSGNICELRELSQRIESNKTAIPAEISEQSEAS